MRRTTALLAAMTIAAGLATAPSGFSASEKAAARDSKAQAYYHFTLGSLYANEGDLERALSEFNEASRLDQSSAEIRVEIAQVYLRGGDSEKAIATARDAIGRAPRDAYSHRALAEALTTVALRRGVEREPLLEAISEYRKIVDLGEADPETLVTLGRLQLQADLNEDAAATFRLLLSRSVESLQGHLLLGRALLRSGQNEEALGQFRYVLERSARQTEALTSVAAIHEQAERWLEAAAAYSELVDLRPADATIKLHMGVCLLRGDKPKEAVEPLQAAATAMPDSAAAARALALALRRSGRPSEALDRYKELLVGSPEDFYLLREVAGLREARGEKDEAAKLLEHALAVAGGSQELKASAVETALELASLHISRNRPAQALEVLAKAESLGAAERSDTALLRCRALLLAGDSAEAERQAASGRERFPKEIRFRMCQAEAEVEAGNNDAAQASVAEALEQSGGDREAVLLAADLWSRRGDSPRALQILEAATKTMPGDDLIWFEWGGALERSGQQERAVAALRRAIDLNGSNHLALNYLGYMLVERGEKLEEAQGLIEKAIALDPDNGAYLDSLGWVLYRRGKAADALPHLSRAVELLAGDSTVREHLGDVLAEIGRWSEAKAEWQRARELGGPDKRLEGKIEKAERERVR